MQTKKASLKIVLRQGLWITGFFKGNWFQAKVYGSPSQYGINGSAVSKLTICSDKVFNSHEILVNYDRGFECNPDTPNQAFQIKMATEFVERLTLQLNNATKEKI